MRLDFVVYAHFGYAVVAYARSCHTTRFYHEKPATCAYLSNSPMELELTDIFDLESLSFAPPETDVKEMFPTLYLLGNATYTKGDFVMRRGWTWLSLIAICMGG